MWFFDPNAHRLARSGIQKSDIKKFSGKWFEIASFDAWFQRGCKCTTATYTPKPDFVQVKNSCVRDGKRDIIVGQATPANKRNTVLKVGFPPLGDYIKGNYVIEYLDKDYRYVIVGSPSKRYLWILSRSPIISNAKYRWLKKVARSMGYNTDNLNKQVQNCSHSQPTRQNNGGGGRG